MLADFPCRTGRVAGTTVGGIGHGIDTEAGAFDESVGALTRARHAGRIEGTGVEARSAVLGALEHVHAASGTQLCAGRTAALSSDTYGIG